MKYHICRFQRNVVAWGKSTSLEFPVSRKNTLETFIGKFDSLVANNVLLLSAANGILLLWRFCIFFKMIAH